MGNARIVPGGLHAVVPHKGLIALREGFLLIAGQVPNGCAQMVGTMLNRNAADLPERLLNAFSQGFKGLAKAHTHRFDIGIGEHAVIEQMRESLPLNRHVEVTHVGEIGLGPFTGDMHLLKDDFPLWSLLRTPLRNVALQCAHLGRAIRAWMALAQLGEQRRSL
jgi:hypothetical protein